MPRTAHHRHTFPPVAALALPEIPDGAANHDVANPELAAWVARTAVLARPDEVVWVDGTAEQWSVLVTAATLQTDTVRLDPGARPGSVLTRSHGARTGRASASSTSASATATAAAAATVVADRASRRAALEDVAESMRGRTMYVVPFLVGSRTSPTLLGVHVTDSPASVAALRALVHVGADALDRIGPDTPFVRTVHATLRSARDDRGARRRDAAAEAVSVDHARVVADERSATVWVLGSDDALAAQRALDEHTRSATRPAFSLVRISGDDGTAARVVALTGDVTSVPGSTPSGRRVELLGAGPLVTTGRDAATVSATSRGAVVSLADLAPTSAVADDAEHDAVFTDAAVTEDGDAWWVGSRDVATRHLIGPDGGYVPVEAAATPHATGAVRFHAAADEHVLDAFVVTTPDGAGSVDAFVAEVERAGLPGAVPQAFTAWGTPDALGELLDELVDGLEAVPAAGTVAA